MRNKQELPNSPKEGEDPPPGSGGKRRYDTVLVVMSVALAVAVASIVILAVYLAGASADTLTLSRGLLSAIEENPRDMVHNLRQADPDGSNLKLALRTVKSESEEEFQRYSSETGDALLGEDQVEFFISENEYGVKNARIVGYLAGCIESAGGDDEHLPYPVGEDGKPYDGACEALYDQEVLRVSTQP